MEKNEQSKVPALTNPKYPIEEHKASTRSLNNDVQEEQDSDFNGTKYNEKEKET